MTKMLIVVHVWTMLEQYEVLGMFGRCTSTFYQLFSDGTPGWFFGDFFMEGFSAQLEYTGIYRSVHSSVQFASFSLIFSHVLLFCRYLNNPEIMSGAAFFGLALISGSRLVFTLAVIRHLSQLWFLTEVEKYVVTLSGSMHHNLHVRVPV